MVLADITWGINMRSFYHRQVFPDHGQQGRRGLFEHLESYANGMRFLIQEKNENGLWGGRVLTCSSLFLIFLPLRRASCLLPRARAPEFRR